MTDLKTLTEEYREMMKELRNLPRSSPEFFDQAQKVLAKQQEIMNHPDRNEP